jgi:hypothetical protein
MIQSNITVSSQDLVRSLANVLGSVTFEAMRGRINNPRILDLAINQAFVYGTGSAEDHAVLRASAVQLERTGCLPI